MKFRSSLIALAVAAAGFVSGSSAFAGTTSGTFNVTATVVAACSITNNPGITFGNYDPITNKTVALDVASSISVLCTKGSAAAVTLDQGLTPTAASTCIVPARQMKDTAGDKLGYAVYSDTGRTTVWGCDTTNKVSFTSASGSAAQVLNSYGRVAAGQDVPVGSYSDTVTATVTF
jgi:spore coat protein U-like protein